MVFTSILFDKGISNAKEFIQPSCFTDLNLDQVIKAIIKLREDYEIEKFFYMPLQDLDLISYRNEIMRDVENTEIFTFIKKFSWKMILVRRYLKLIDTLNFDYSIKGWILDTALEYCNAVNELKSDLKKTQYNSRGIREFTEFLNDYTSSKEFISLFTDAKKVKSELSAINYTINIESGKFTVFKYEDEIDYSVEVLKIFDKFKQGAVKDYRVKLIAKGNLSHIEAKILDFVSQLFPEPFQSLDKFCNDHQNIVDKKILLFDSEIQFYMAYIQFMEKIKNNGLKFCYPQVSSTKQKDFCNECFDIGLALKSLSTNETIITNDYSLSKNERIIVVSGPNQGGKTTFARMFGQLHYLASLGCAIPGTKAQIFLADQIFTHFEKEESILTLEGKLQDELKRIHDILEKITPGKSIVIINEIFTSTTLQDAIFLSKEVLKKLESLDVYTVIVSFIDELSKISSKTISMVSMVDESNPAIRTFKIVKRPSDGLAYAISIAKKHNLTYDQINERIKQ